MKSMQHPKRLVSIPTKLTWLVLSSLAAAVLMASMISMWHEANRFLCTKQETILATAQVFGAAASAAIARHDVIGVGQALRGITHIPHLLYAEVANVEGEQLAGIGSAVRLVSDLDIGDMSASTSLWPLLQANTVAVTTPVINGGKIVGKLTLIGESDLRRQIWKVLGYAFVGSMIALVASS